jgi:hypothetical protein
MMISEAQRYENEFLPFVWNAIGPGAATDSRLWGPVTHTGMVLVVMSFVNLVLFG